MLSLAALWMAQSWAKMATKNRETSFEHFEHLSGFAEQIRRNLLKLTTVNVCCSSNKRSRFDSIWIYMDIHLDVHGAFTYTVVQSYTFNILS